MKKLLALTLGTAFTATVATPVLAENFLDYTGVYAAATYTTPSNNGLSMGDMITQVPAAGAIDTFNRALFVQPGFSWDYNVGINYHFPHTHTRAFLDYDNFQDNKERQANGVRDLGAFPAAAGPTTNASARVEQHMDEWRLGLTHYLHFGSRFFVDFSAYVEYDRVLQAFYEHNTGGAPIGGVTTTAFRETDNSFDGWGPGVGFRITGIPYAPCPNFSLFAGAMTTLLYTKDKFHEYEYFNAELFYAYSPENSRSILGKLDIDFGIDYRNVLHMNNTKLRSGVTLGVRYMNIFNAFKNGNTYFNPFPTAAAGGFAANTGYPNDFGRVGPYLQFRIGGMHA